MVFREEAPTVFHSLVVHGATGEAVKNHGYENEVEVIEEVENRIASENANHTEEVNDFDVDVFTGVGTDYREGVPNKHSYWDHVIYLV